VNPITVAVIVPILLLCVGAFCWTVGSRRAERRGNATLLAYARGSGDMLESLGHSLPDPRPLAEQIEELITQHHYTVDFATNVGLARRPDGSRAFTFSMVKPQFLPEFDWPAMLMTQLRYQLHKDRSGQFFTNSVIPIPRPEQAIGRRQPRVPEL
jgi:hypothetical protein